MVPLSEAPIVALLSAQQRALVARIASANTPGNLEGLFAYLVIDQEPAFPLDWNVAFPTEEWLATNADQLNQSPILAALGYALSLFGATRSDAAIEAFITGLNTLRNRPPFPNDRISFAYQPVAFLGLALGALASGERGSTHSTWLASVLADKNLVGSNYFHSLQYYYIRYLLSAKPVLIENWGRFVAPEELALLAWGIWRGAFRLGELHADLSKLQAQVLAAGLEVDTTALTPSRAAIIWSALHLALFRTVEELVLSRSHVAAILRRFEDALRRWRWDSGNARNPINWPITSEREVQDIVWLILRSVFDDVVDEDTLPKVGHSSYKADFGIPSLRLIVEVKYAREASDFKKIEKEIMEDTVAYLTGAGDRYDRILVFVYDHSSSVQEHSMTTNSIRRLPSIEDVVIVSRPSQLPPFQLDPIRPTPRQEK